MVAGVVAEFNPFHYGHKYQVDKIKADIKIAVISPDFVQRGEVSILNQKDKTEIALEMGYDIVVGIPTKYAIQNAEIFCNYSTRLLEELGADYQVFGAETDKIEDIYLMMDKLEKSILKDHLKSGFSYNKSCEKALGDLSYLYTSNNILAMEYLRTIRNYDLNIKPYIIKRKLVNYNEEKICSNISSATNIRKMIKNGQNVEKYLPFSKKYQYNLNYENKLYTLFKFLILTRKFENIFDLKEDIFNKMLKVVKKTNDYFEFLKLMSSRNISINRVKRLMLNIILEIKKEDISKNSEIKQIKILGINEKGAKYIKNRDKICVNFKDLIEEDKFKQLYSYLFEEYSFTNTKYYESR